MPAPGLQIAGNIRRRLACYLMTMNVATASDRRVMRLAAAGDPAAFHGAVERFGARVLRFLACLISDQSRARDLAQESFLRLHQRFSNGGERSGEGDPTSLLFTIAANLGRDELRRRTVRRETPLPEHGVARTLAVESNLERDERHLQVKEVLAELEPETRLLLVLREIQELSYDEIGGIQGIPLGTVKSRVSRARRAFRDAWCRRMKRQEGASP